MVVLEGDFSFFHRRVELGQRTCEKEVTLEVDGKWSPLDEPFPNTKQVGELHFPR